MGERWICPVFLALLLMLGSFLFSKSNEKYAVTKGVRVCQSAREFQKADLNFVQRIVLETFNLWAVRRRALVLRHHSVGKNHKLGVKAAERGGSNLTSRPRQVESTNVRECYGQRLKPCGCEPSTKTLAQPTVDNGTGIKYSSAIP